jgi:hypothetical protein
VLVTNFATIVDRRSADTPHHAEVYYLFYKLVKQMNIKLRWLALGLYLSVMISFSIFVPIESTHSQEANNQQADKTELGLVKNRADLIRLSGKKVKLVGHYTAKIWKTSPSTTGNPDFRGLYIKSQIVLEDGTEVSIFPSWNKQSLRSKRSISRLKYDGKNKLSISTTEEEIIKLDVNRIKQS